MSTHDSRAARLTSEASSEESAYAAALASTDGGEDAGPGAGRAASGGRPPTSARWRPGWPRLGVLDWIAVGLLALGLVFVATGLLPAGDAVATMERIAPLLLFLFAVLILAELTAQAEFFDVVAVRMAIAGRGSYPALFALSVTLAALTTMFLNLDTTAVLLTPVMLATAARAGISAVPLAMTTVWLANTASLLLPVSNLTNLLAADRVGLPVLPFAERMSLPQAAALATSAICLWVFHWRRGRRADDRYSPPSPFIPRDPILFRVAAVTCVAFVVGILSGVPIEAVSVLCALVLGAAFAWRAREHLHWRLVPWRLLVFLSGLFLVVQTVSEHCLSTLLRALVGTDSGAEGVWRAAATGGTLSNLINNLPAYVAAEAVVPAGNADQVLGLLLGTNIGPLILPWASLATLLWLERCRAAGVSIPWPRFLASGAVTAVVVLSAAVGGLLLTG